MKQTIAVVDRETGIELRPVDCTAYLATELLLNSSKLFRAIEQLTARVRIASFSGLRGRGRDREDGAGWLVQIET